MEDFSQRVRHINESPLTRWDSKVNSEGVEIVRLNAGQPNFNIPTVIAEEIKKTTKIERNNFYTSVNGTIKVRKAIFLFQKKIFDMDYGAEEIILTNGAKEGIFISLGALIDPDDEVIIVAPYWSTYLETIKLFKGKPLIINTSENFHLDVDEIKKAVTIKTKAIIVNSPNNPSGAVYTKKELEQLAEIAIYHDLYVISDEIYSTIRYDSKNYCSVASLEGMRDRTVVINGFSKNLSVTGYRLGYTLSSMKIAEAMLKIKSNSTGNTNSFFQIVIANALLNHFDELDFLRESIKNELKKRRDFLCGELNKLDIKYINPEGTFYVFAQISDKFGMSSEKFAEDLLINARVAVAPGIFFGEDFDNYIRISFSSSMEEIREALKRMENYISKKRVN